MKDLENVSGGINWVRYESNVGIEYCGFCEWKEDILPEECPECGKKINWYAPDIATFAGRTLSLGVCENSHSMRVYRH